MRKSRLGQSRLQAGAPTSAGCAAHRPASSAVKDLLPLLIAVLWLGATGLQGAQEAPKAPPARTNGAPLNQRILPSLASPAGLEASSARGELPPALVQGILEEEGNLDLRAAIRAYQSVLTQFDDQRRGAVNALFRLGECYRKLGQTNEAQAQYRRILLEFPDQTEFVRLCQQLVGPQIATEAAKAEGGATAAKKLTPAQLKLLQDEIKLVERQIAEATKRLENGKASTADVIKSKQDLFSLQRQLPENAAPAKQGALVDQQIKLVEQLLAEVKARTEVGAAAPIDSVPLQRELLALQREKEAQARPAETAVDSVSGEIVTDEEAKEIQRIKALIQNSPDLINASDGGGNTRLHIAAAAGQLVVARFLLANHAAVNLRSRQTQTTPLIFAASAGHRAMVELLLANGADVNAVDLKGKTALMEAAAKGFKSVVEVLLANKADPGPQDSDGSTALILATSNGQTDIVERLLTAVAEVNVADKKGRTPLSFAAGAGNRRIVELLLAKGAHVDPKGPNTFPPLMAAVQNRRLEIAALLLQHHADVNVKTADGGTPLFQAAVANEQTEMVKLLLEHGAEPNVRGVYDMPGRLHRLEITPLHVAAGRGNQEVVELLLRGGADVNATDGEGAFPLHYAVGYNQPATAEMLLGKGANPRPRVNWSVAGSIRNVTPLELAIDLKIPTMVELLLAKGAEVEPADAANSPLHRAVDVDDPQVMQALLARKPNLDVEDRNNMTPLQKAVGNKKLKMASLLLDAGANVNVTHESDGKTPLFWAVEWLNKDMVELLLAHKAEVNILDRNGKAPWSYLPTNKPGSSSGIQSVIRELLLKAGANENLERQSFITISRPSENFTAAWFEKGTNNCNRFTLLELIASFYSRRGIAPKDSMANRSPGPFEFPDLPQVKIDRLASDGRSAKTIPVNVAALLKSGVRSEDPWLEWGDLVEIPELDHPVSEKGDGYPPDFGDTLTSCVKRTVRMSVKDQIYTLMLIPFATEKGGPERTKFSPETGPLTPQSAPKQIKGASFWLHEVVNGSALLRTSSDTSRVKVKRVDPDTKQTREFVFNLQQTDPRTFWLRDGDLIEVPEKE